MTSRELATALRANGSVFCAFAEQMERADERLRERKVQTLDLHFLTYAGLVAINENLPTQRERNLATFALRHGPFEQVDATDVVERLCHDRW